MGLVVLIDRPGYRLGADRKVIKGVEASVIGEVAQAFAVAKQQIGVSLSGVERACAQRREEAYREGLAKAHRDAAQRLALAEVDRAALLKSLQPALVDVIVDAVALLVKGLERKALIARALEALQGSLRDSSWARLCVHPDAVTAAQAALAEFDRETGLGKLARVAADESLPLDGCVFESEFGKVDASLGTQLAVIHAAITDAARKLAASAA